MYFCLLVFSIRFQCVFKIGLQKICVDLELWTDAQSLEINFCMFKLTYWNFSVEIWYELTINLLKNFNLFSITTIKKKFFVRLFFLNVFQKKTFFQTRYHSLKIWNVSKFMNLWHKDFTNSLYFLTRFYNQFSFRSSHKWSSLKNWFGKF